MEACAEGEKNAACFLCDFSHAGRSALYKDFARLEVQLMLELTPLVTNGDLEAALGLVAQRLGRGFAAATARRAS